MDSLTLPLLALARHGSLSAIGTDFNFNTYPYIAFDINNEEIIFHSL